MTDKEYLEKYRNRFTIRMNGILVRGINHKRISRSKIKELKKKLRLTDTQ